MGMFDWVNAPPITCDCGEQVDGWQSKDGWCSCGTISPEEVDCYYSSCESCGMWHEFQREKPNPKPPFVHIKTPKVDCE